MPVLRPCPHAHYKISIYPITQDLKRMLAAAKPTLCPAAPKKKGKKMDVLESAVTDPRVWDELENPRQTAWRIDRMKNMTYTQFWQLVKERRVDKVSA